MTTAYALIPATEPGMFHAVRLRGVVAESIEQLVPGDNHSTKRMFAMTRLIRALEVDVNNQRRGK